MARFPAIFLLLCVLPTTSTNASSDRNQERARLRRQFETKNGPQIDLNITVPYIFSARLYPYGLSKGDQITHMDPQPLDLHVPLQFFGFQYQTIFIHKDGLISASSTSSFLPPPSQNQMPLIAVYWMPSRGGRVFYRETTDSTILNLSQSEVNIQYRYGTSFKPKSVLIVTWEGSSDATDANTKDGNVFQIALVLADSGCFAHVIYSRLRTNNNAAAGFSGANGQGGHFSLPGSGTPNAIQLMERSNIGIPGEWLFRIDESQIYLCGAGFQGIECVDPCGPTQWYLDCSRTCHCANGEACDVETGTCPESKCSPGWTGAPTCDQDVDECEDQNLCPIEQPDCVNTPGAYLCLCFEYDNITNTCKGSITGPSQRIPVSVMPLVPQIAPLVEKPQRRPSIRVEGLSTANFHPSTHYHVSTTLTTTQTPILMQTLQPLTIRPILSDRRSTVCPKCDIHAVCVNSQCECSPGWQGNGINCVDIDECQTDQICGGENFECQNSAGSFQCICSPGFVSTPNGCVDLDECSEGVVCRGGNTSVCVNKHGGFECQCAKGYTGHPESQEGCVDIDECDTPELYCGNKSKCLNTQGSYLCECFEGYEQVRNSTQCVDFNECLTSDKNAICTNFDGTFECNCVEGFVGNGIECKETILFSTGRNISILPATENANIPYHLEAPLNLFNHAYDTAFISANGVVSFDRTFSEVVSQPREIRSVAIFPFHLTNNLIRGGTISARQVTDSDASNYGILTKASLMVQNKLNLKKFQATSVLIVTYDKVVPVTSDGTNTVNTFQCVVAQSTNASFVIFLYESMQELNSHFVGITHPSGFMELPTNELTRRSNIGQAGKWIFQINRDGHIGRCPVGKVNPPFCEQDCEPGTWGFECSNVCRCQDNMPCDFISGVCSNGKCREGYTGNSCSEDLNECSSSLLNKCSVNATCTNLNGGYECRCKDQFYGDGFTCKALDRCYKRFNKECTQNAYCDETNVDYPECVCHEHYHGDGRHFCEPDSSASETPPSATTTKQRMMISNGRSKEASDEHPFIVKNWNSVENAVTPSKENPPQRPNETRLKFNHKEGNSILEEEGIQEQGKADSVQNDASERMFLYLILPGIFMAVWLVLIVSIIVICCRRQRRSRLNKYSPQAMSWSPRDYTTTRNSFLSQTAFT